VLSQIVEEVIHQVLCQVEK